MKAGKKSVAEGIIYGSFEIIENRSKEEPFRIFKKALENVKPNLEVKSRRVGGSTYQVPIEIRGDRRTALVFLLDY
jgi:small subunit ribosomal protein S7